MTRNLEKTSGGSGKPAKRGWCERVPRQKKPFVGKKILFFETSALPLLNILIAHHSIHEPFRAAYPTAYSPPPRFGKQLLKGIFFRGKVCPAGTIGMSPVAADVTAGRWQCAERSNSAKGWPCPDCPRPLRNDGVCSLRSVRARRIGRGLTTDRRGILRTKGGTADNKSVPVRALRGYLEFGIAEFFRGVQDVE
jgi:hypothetical protein